jgi:hypothetical protein
VSCGEINQSADGDAQVRLGAEIGRAAYAG